MIIRPGSAVLLILLAFAGYVMLADFFNLRQARSIEEPGLSTLTWPQPWGGYGRRELVISMGDDWMIDPEITAKLIESASVHYPLDARQWLDRARISASRGDFGQVDLLLNKAIAIRPLHRPTLWSAAQIALQTGDADLAESQLRQWLQLYPGDTGQALFIGRRWISDPGALIDRMLPAQREYLEEAMQVALSRNDFSLAEEVWKRLEPKPSLDDPTFLQYVELLLDTGKVARATELWAERDPSWRPGMLVNGDFARELGDSLGLNWRRRFAPPGVLIERDLAHNHSSPASLKVAFNGKENVRLNRPWIRIPVTPGGRYRLSGVWRAEGLTTRALPYLHLSARASQFSETVEVPNTEFDWTPWSIEFSVPEDSQLMRLVLRRDSSQAFDRYIDGEVWLDDFRLEPIAAPQPENPLQSAASEALGREAAVKGTVSGFRFPVTSKSGARRKDQGAMVGTDAGSTFPDSEGDAANTDRASGEDGIGSAPTQAAKTDLPAPETGNRKPGPEAP